MKIDFVSDVACPWCAVGLNSLERALDKIGSDIPVELHFQPFELNPQMPSEGEDAGEYLSKKYGLSPQQLESNRAALRERGASVGFEFGQRTHIWNTFDAHRLLCWAGDQGGDKQRALKHALLRAYHGRGENPSAPGVLLQAAIEAGLDEVQAGEVIGSDRYAAEVRAAEHRWERLGVTAVPSAIVDGKYLIQGGQPPEVFEQTLRKIAAGAD